jgi:outer membrane protein OmpA-like peptidoglycan-associated protein
MKKSIISALILLVSNGAFAQSSHAPQKYTQATVQNAKPVFRYLRNTKIKEKPVKIFYFEGPKTYLLCGGNEHIARPVPAGYAIQAKPPCKCETSPLDGLDVMLLSPESLPEFFKTPAAYQTFCANSVIYVKGKDDFLMRIQADSVHSDNTTVLEYVEKAKTTQEQAFANVQFDFDSSTINLSSYATLDTTSAQIKRNRGGVELSGFASSEGTAAHNAKLSRDRANAVKTYLVNSGVEARLLKVKAYGETHPIADNSTEDGRIQNRRVEFRQQ